MSYVQLVYINLRTLQSGTQFSLAGIAHLDPRSVADFPIARRRKYVMMLGKNWKLLGFVASYLQRDFTLFILSQVVVVVVARLTVPLSTIVTTCSHHTSVGDCKRSLLDFLFAMKDDTFQNPLTHVCSGNLLSRH